MELKDVSFEKKMICHMAFETYHISKYEYRIIADGSLLDGRMFYSEHITRKRRDNYGRFGKTEDYYYFEGTKKGGEFKSVEELLESAGIKAV